MPHRVTSYFCEDVDGSLRSDLLRHVAGMGMSSSLRSEIRAYQMCKIDDTWAEAAHRDISGFKKRSAASKVAHTAASQRLAQNLARYDAMAPCERGQFYELLKKHQAVGQTIPKRALALRRVKKKASLLHGQVYRSDVDALRDWGAELGPSISALPDKPSQRRSVATRLQLEYLASAIEDGEVLSLPLVSDEAYAQVARAALQDRPALLRNAPAKEWSYFIVIVKAAKRKKQMRTAALERDNMLLPVSLQRMALWPAGLDEDPPQLLAYYDGYPHIADVFHLAPWPVLRSGLLKWRAGASSVSGCVSLSDASASVPALGSDGVPALLLLEDLVAKGWTRGQPPAEHTLASCKQFRVKDPIAAKSYLRCLVALDKLLVSDSFVSLRSDQPMLYYACVLASDEPGQVPLNSDVASYKRMLASPDAGEPDAGADTLALLHQGADNSAATSSSDEVVVSSRTVVAAKRKPSHPGSAKAQQTQKEDWHALVGLAAQPPVQLPEPTLDEQRGQLLQDMDTSVASSSGVRSAAPLEVAVASSQRGSVSSTSCLRSYVEGVAVYEEAHGVAGQRGSYRRLAVVCEHHACKRGACRKRRNFGTRSGQQSGLGDLEPWAFLGVWLRAHARFEDADAHVKYSPSASEVMAYVQEQQWLPAGQH